jgi:hypothetical protein
MGNQSSSASFEPLVDNHLNGLFNVAVSLKTNNAELQQNASAALDQNVIEWISVINSAMPGMGTMIGDVIRASVQHEISIAFAIICCHCVGDCTCDNAELLRISLAEMQSTQESIVSSLHKVVGQDALWRHLLSRQLVGIVNYCTALSRTENSAGVQRECFLHGKELSAALTRAIIG